MEVVKYVEGEKDMSTFKLPSDAVLARAVKANGVISIGGQFNPVVKEGLSEAENAGEQADAVFKRVVELAKAGGSDVRNFTMVNLYITNPANMPAIEEAWLKHFGQDNPIPRIPLVVGFPNPKSLVAVTATAVDPNWQPK